MIDKIQSILADYQPDILGKQRKFAVLLPLIKVHDAYHVLYQVRAKHISQGGQTSFPGGSVEVDESFQEAALRETREELQLGAANIRLLGEIDYIVSEWAIVHCFVGEIIGIAYEDIVANEEVAYLFLVPLDTLVNLKPIHYDIEFETVQDDEFPLHLVSRDQSLPIHRRHTVSIYNLPNEELLWGFTANLTERFIQILQQDASFRKDTK